jgi:peptide/nickel transport system ATP-binding protein
MKDGEIVESGAAVELFTNPRIEYTRELVASVPTVDLNDNELEIAEDTAVSKDVILNIQNLNVYYKEQKKGVLTSKNRKQVVKDITISVREGESLGIVGESGCGKSSLAKAIVGLNDEIEGTIQITDINGENKVSRVKPQMVFQDPYASLNPTKKVGWILEEPLKMQNKYKKAERKEKVLTILEQVGLAEKYLERYPYQLSGGQRQRVAIAAALILNPKLIVLDEPVSSLDVTVQAQIISLLKELQQKYHLTYLFISHDLKVIYQICNRVSVMYQGEVVETNTTSEVFFHPIHDYTKELLGSALI